MATRRWLQNPRQVWTGTQASNASGRVTFTFDPPFANPPWVDFSLRYASAAGCSAYQVGDVTNSSVTIEVRKPKALVLGLVGVAHEVAPAVTVALRAEALD